MPQLESFQLAKCHSNCKAIRAVLYQLPMLLIPLTALAQGSSPGSPNRSGFREPAQGLRFSRDVKVAGSTGWLKTKCDADGNIYVRLLNNVTRGAHGSGTVPVQKLGPEGTLGALFKIPHTSPVDTRAIAYFASAEGGVYLGAYSGAERSVFVLGFSPDGILISTTKLATPYFLPYQIAAFRSGEFLLSGIQGPELHTPFTGVFARNGQLLKNVSDPEDEDARKRADAGEAGYKLDGGTSGNRVVVSGDVAMGSDGNAYLLRWGPTALVYVISSNGAVLRKMRISAPQSGLVARDIKGGPGELAIGFQEPGHESGVVEDIDLEGNTLGTYAADDQGTLIPGELACYTKQGFTFINNLNEPGNVHLRVGEK